MSLRSPLSTIGMPYYREKLLSAWGNDRVFEVGKPPSTLDPDLLTGSRRGPGNIGLVAPNSRDRFRNQVDRPALHDSVGNSALEPKYLSDKTRISANGKDSGVDVNDITALFARFALCSNPGDAPHGYKAIQIRYGGPRGVQDFDFG